ncbi:TBC1 domain family member 31 isoform X4 [Rhea pennata]|uniref:TBC1 domain family member 31 isoform X4 n=1 Tax=Rhea pennata TaxID=8795 RepID=UPI002E25968D
MQRCDLGGREQGPIWHRRPSPAARQGVMVNIVHSATGYHSKTIRFLNVAFDNSGDCLLAGDHQGNIYVFDLNGNRFSLVQRTMQACTALAFNLRRKTEFLVALADYSIKCFDTDTKELVSWMKGHNSSVSSISVHGSGRYAITTSPDTAQLWDLDTFQRKRKLNVRQSVGIQKVFFLPLSNTILSCFKDNSVFAWEFDTLQCKYQLPTSVEGSVLLYKVFAVTRDGRIFVAGGKSNHLHLWCLESKQLLRIIQMPTEVRTVRHLEFLPDSFDGGSNQVLGVLSQDNIMRFINIETCKLLFNIGSHEEGISTAAISPNGRYIASVMESGSLNLYSVQALTQEVNKPPPPLFKVVEDWSKCKLGANKLTMRVTSGRPEHPWKSRGSKIQTRLLKPQVNTSLANKENELPGGLNKKRLQALLKGFGEYPAKYRMFVWRSLLQLPENHLAFSSLIDKGIHSAFVHIQNEYPIKSRKLLRVLQRAPLLHCNQTEDFEYFFHHRNNLDINVVIKEAYHLMESTPVDIHPQHMLDDFIPLTKGQYPVFNKYPKFIVDYQTQERERIRQDEIAYLRERQLVYELEAKAQERKVGDEAWYRKQELLQEAEEQRRKMLLEEEEKLAEQRQRLAAVKRELKIRELQLLDAARRRFLKYQQDQRQMELKRLDDEIARKASIREQETAATAQDIEVRQMELESQRQLFEQYLIKDQETVMQEMKGEIDTSRRKADLEDHLVQQLIEVDQGEKTKARMVAEEKLTKAEQKCIDTDWRMQALHKLRCEDQDREEHYKEIAKLLHDNRIKEAELLRALREAEEKKLQEVMQKKAQLEAEQKAAVAADEHRKQFLEDEMNDALELAEKLQKEDGYFERLGGLKAGDTETGLGFQQVSKSGNICLNDLSASESSSHDQRREELPWKERELMAEVRQLREKLTSRAQTRRSPTRFPATKWTP